MHARSHPRSISAKISGHLSTPGRLAGVKHQGAKIFEDREGERILLSESFVNTYPSNVPVAQQVYRTPAAFPFAECSERYWYSFHQVGLFGVFVCPRAVQANRATHGRTTHCFIALIATPRIEESGQHLTTIRSSNAS